MRVLNVELEQRVIELTFRLQQALDFEAMLKRITDKVRDSLDASQICQTAVQELGLVLGISCCNAALYDLNQGTSTIYYEYTTSMHSQQGQVVQMANFSEIYQPLLQGQYFQFCSIDPNLIGHQVMILACPIFDDQGFLGDLWLLHHNDYVFNELEIRLVQQVANQCAIALRQARLCQAAQAQVMELEKLNRLKDDFLNTISHELRTPVTNMKMAIQMIKIAPNAEQFQRYLEILEAECTRETSLINDLLDLQRLDAGSYGIFLTEAVNLQDWLPRIIEPFLARIQERQLFLKVDIPPELPPLVCDLSSLERILAELLNNACKYTPAGEQIMVTASTKEAKMQLRVSNSGAEIPERDLPRIFDKFYRVPSTTGKQGGAGLGLALVKSLTERLGGSIRVDSGSDKTCFTVELPI